MTEIVEATLNGAYTLKLPKHRADRPEWFTEHGWEKARMEALVETIDYKCGGSSDPLPLVYYVGAEEGELCAICAMAGAEMYLFEPNPRAWPNIKAVFEANNLPMPYTFPGFASNKSADMDISVSQEWPGCATGEIIGNHGFKELHSEALYYPQIKIDHVWKQPGLRPPDIITMDVEGSEFEVLRGAEQTILKHKPTLFISLHPEFLVQFWGEYSRDLRNWVIDRGYDEELLAWDHEAHFVYRPR